MKKNIGQDFKDLLDDKYLKSMAESHLDCWEERYAGKFKTDIGFDLNVNHDDSLEIERVEEDLKRPLTDDENITLIKLFHKKVLSIYNRSYYIGRRLQFR